MALVDRAAIMDYIAEDSPAAALALDEDFEAHAVRACRTPTLYRPGRLKGTREIVVHPHYVMVYRVEPAAIVVLRVLHAALQWPPVGEATKKGRSK